ncbi:hypothetical protein QAD02_002023 [Eretmocerus hayati]|uniref:Uncharacterized protein n=1 Tax=Eretmocerus hayati TaxID=131215 RepID=A0ACC2NHN9_9HYME|nr:hypothetical protein QAD02_002023 [Eretmocerus hayati]
MDDFSGRTDGLGCRGSEGGRLGEIDACSVRADGLSRRSSKGGRLGQIDACSVRADGLGRRSSKGDKPGEIDACSIRAGGLGRRKRRYWSVRCDPPSSGCLDRLGAGLAGRCGKTPGKSARNNLLVASSQRTRRIRVRG